MYFHWLVVEPPTPLKNHGVKVSWDDEIPYICKNKIHGPNHQPVMYVQDIGYQSILSANCRTFN